MLSLSAVTDEEGHPLENEDGFGRRLCEYWGTIFQAREGGPRHHQHEDILRYVQQAPDDISWTIDQAEFDDLFALKKDSAPMARGVRQGCPASGFLFAMAFDPIFRWLQETLILEFLQPAQCAYADNLAVASSSFRVLMIALAPAFRSVDSIAGLNLNYRKCCWVEDLGELR